MGRAKAERSQAVQSPEATGGAARRL